MCKAVIGKKDEGRGEKRERICKAMKREREREREKTEKMKYKIVAFGKM